MIFSTGMDTLGMHDWQTTDIEVRIKETHDDSGLIGQTGIIRGVSVSFLNVGFFVPMISFIIINLKRNLFKSHF